MIKIDFEQSHLFFPKIMICISILLFLIIVIKFLPNRIREFKNRKNKISFFEEGYDKFKFYGTLILIAIYFKGMELIGMIFPNTGFGFLISSIIFIFLISLLFTGKPNKRNFIALSLNSILTPLTAWFVFGTLFNITLP